MNDYAKELFHGQIKGFPELNEAIVDIEFEYTS